MFAAQRLLCIVEVKFSSIPTYHLLLFPLGVESRTNMPENHGFGKGTNILICHYLSKEIKTNYSLCRSGR